MTVLSAVLLLVASLILHGLYRGIRNNLSHVPGPSLSRWTGIVNTYHWLGGKWPKYVHSLHQQYGPIVRVSPGKVCVANLDSFKEIHRVGGRYLKSDYYQMLVPPPIVNVFSFIDPQSHSNRRRLLATPISDSSLGRMEPIIAGNVRLAATRVREELEERGAVDVYKWWLYMATDIIGELSFGKSFEMLERKKKNQYIIDLEVMASTVNVRIAFPTLIKAASVLPLPVFMKFPAAWKRVQMYGRQSLDRYESLVSQNPSEAKPMLFTKLYNDEKYDLTDNDILSEAMGYIVAGSDTTAYTLTCLTYAVCKNPEIRETLVAELATLPDGFTEKDTRPMRYLDQVISEALRVYPSVPSLPRRVPPEGGELAGYPVPGGVTVATQVYSLNRDKKIFPNPEEFNPGRWANASKEMKDALMTFGGGSRICLGMHLARMELRLATAHFFRSFPRARVSAKEGMSDSDMEIESGFISIAKGRRCLIDVGDE